MKAFWKKNARLLVDCAMGRKAASLVIKNGIWVCVQTGEYIENTDIAVISDRIAYVGPDASHTIDKSTKIIDAKGKFLVPGLIDAHMHVESGMLTVTEFVSAVLPRGTTAMFIDPHEIANVLGLKGVRLMVDEALKQPNHVLVQIPSCVPSNPGFETPGGTIDADDVAEGMKWEGVIGLGEMMNFPAVAANDEKVHKEMEIARDERMIIGGHYPSLDLGLPFYGYVAGGAQDDHEGTRVEDAIARARLGMKVMMRYGSAWLDVENQIKAITEHGLDSRNFILCTDDSHSATLVFEGNMDRVVRHTIQQGIEPMVAIQMATINSATHFRTDSEIGQIAPGRYADILVVENLVDFAPDLVIAKGNIVAEHGILTIKLPEIDYPEWALKTVHISKPVNSDQFCLAAPDNGKDKVKVNVIGLIENQAPTKYMQLNLAVHDGFIKIDKNQDVAKLAVLDRHHDSGRIQLGFVSGFGFTEDCAVATTVAHDSHQLIVTGTDEEAMAMAVNRLVEIGGGQVVIKDRKIIGEVALPIAGLVSNRPAAEVAKAASTVLSGFKKCGCLMNNPNMQLSLLGLVVIPDLRLSDLGLVDVNKMKFISVICD
jgi:adenine deaminase